MRFKRHLAAAVGVLSLLALTGCSGGDGMAALNRAPTSDDQLPSYVLTQDLDVDSVRKAVDHDGVTYFISEPAEGNGFCVARTKGQDETAWGTACSTGTGNVVTSQTMGIPGTVTLVTDGYVTDELEEEGWTRIHDNLLIR